jgi:hypothetical protein
MALNPRREHKGSGTKCNGFGVLRAILETAREKAECGLSDLTVLSAQVDPYRLDTPSGHRDGKWLAEQLDRAIGKKRKIHWRGLHYALVSTSNLVKPNGDTYRNDDDNWQWLINVAGKAARWLGYIPFERITGNRNAEPFIHHKARVKPQALVRIGIEVTVPDASDLEPTPDAEGFEGRQPYCFAIFGEKASLEDVLLPIARARQADLYLPAGEISDTLIFRIAKDAAADGRPLVMFTVADCDPAGHQMPVSIGRKLQAFRDLHFPKLRFEVVPVALTVEQVGELELPSSPLKETERRADRWRQAFGVEQTEIDALATLQPDVLREIVEAALRPYYDDTLEDRVDEAREDWMQRAQAAIDAQVDPERLAGLREQATGRLAELEAAINDINEQLRLAADGFRLPAIEVPQPEIDQEAERSSLGPLRGQLGEGDARADRSETVRQRSGLMSAKETNALYRAGYRTARKRRAFASLGITAGTPRATRDHCRRRGRRGLAARSNSTAPSIHFCFSTRGENTCTFRWKFASSTLAILTAPLPLSASTATDRFPHRLMLWRLRRTRTARSSSVKHG